MRSAANKLVNLFLKIYLSPLLMVKKIRKKSEEILVRNNLKKVIHLLDVKKITEKDVYIVDVGAYLGLPGDTTPSFAEAFPDYAVYAFEPFDDSFTSLVNNTKKYTNVIPVHAALSDLPGETTLYVTSQSHSASLLKTNSEAIDKLSEKVKGIFPVVREQKVKSSTLDTMFDDKSRYMVAILKIDTQGNELNVLKGASRVLKRTILVTLEMANHNTYEHAGSYQAIDSFLTENGFLLADITPSIYQNNIIYEWDSIYVNKNYIDYIKVSS